jgi:ATP-binding cassette subfamily F protein 3
VLQVSDLSKQYGERVLFEGVSFGMIPGEKLGLVGRNGCGKSTLFRIIMGSEHPDSGKITTPKDYRIGHLEQHLKFTKPTVLEEACLGLPAYSRDYEEYKAEMILAGLGFSYEDMVLKSPADFSGGYQIRINLAKLLLSEPNLLLLDEPTNYLDIVSVLWLQEFLKQWEGEIIMISHDREFMDAISTHSMLIHRGAIRKIAGRTAKLYDQVLVDEEIYEKTRVNEEKKRKELELFISRFRAQASKATLVQSKVKALERMGVKQELQDEDSLDFRFNDADFPGKQMLEAKDLQFGYEEDQDLLGNLSFTLQKGERIGVIGKNGKGKSTLLKLIASEMQAKSGSLFMSPNCQIGYFGQTNISRLNPKLTVEAEILNANPMLHVTKVRAICGTMMFSGDDALKKISMLSGGEKSRVLIGKILAQPTNLLMLDEPTNHLDMESIEALVSSLKTYSGALLIVTHSEMILRELATSLIVFKGDKPEFFPHDYNYFLSKVGWEE